MLFNTLVKVALVATAFAQPVQHQHHQHEKKDVVTHTVIVTVNGDAADSAETSIPEVPDVVTSLIASSVTPSAASATPASSTSSTSVSSSSSSFSADVKGITYSPYTDAGGCKTKEQIASEFEALTGYEIIRLYGVDCSQVEYVLAAMSSSQKLFAGIYDMTRISDDVVTLAAAVEAANGWDQVYTVSIGNELVNSGDATASQVKEYVAEGRLALTNAGYTGPVVSVDTFIAIYENTDLCDISDYVAANAHAYFDGGYAAADAGIWVYNQYTGLQNTCSGKEVFIVESGWPTAGDTNGAAIAGTSEQAAALSNIADKVGDHVLYFNAYNDGWKDPGYLNCEQYWGILSS